MRQCVGAVIVACLLAARAVAAPPVDASRPPVDFNRDVRPILSETCFKCHGADDGARKAKLRLDVRDGAVKGGASGEAAIAPGKPDASALVRRVFSSDPDEVMPPPGATKVTLSDAQKQTLKQWVAEGAVYKPHWAFVAPVAAALPTVRQRDWPRNPIDRFVLARLEQAGLAPSPEADRYTLIRRVSLDLTGLPPTPAEADAFTKDDAPDAYDRLVDRLLASPRYGERWARRWLDLARYADTNGYEKDRPRSIWPYRDWVIRALNSDMPFDQFTIEQLAGDLLPNASVDQRIATGFHRNTMLNEEGGIDPLEFRFHAVVDRVGTTGTTWLGLTVACAQCHTHKYDPLTHTEYYRLMAFLNNADEPELDLPLPEADAARRRDAEERAAKLAAELPKQFPVGDVTWHVPESAAVAAREARAERTDDGGWRFAGPLAERETYTFEFDAPAAGVNRIRLEAMKDGAAGPGRTPHGNFVLTEITATVAPQDAPTQAQPVKFARAEADFSQQDFAVAAAIDGKAATGWAIADPAGPIKARTATFFLAEPVTLPGGAHWTIKLEQNYGRQHTLGRLRLSLGAKASDAAPVEVRRSEALQKSFAGWEAAATAKAVRWTVIRPAEMKSSTPTLTLLGDDSVLASGDITKSDTYDLTFRGAPKGVTAVRLEALPDDSLPKHGPGLTYYEGPAGDFCLSEITLTAGDAPAPFAKAAHTFASGKFTAAAAIDGNPQTGWMINPGQGKPHTAVFGLAAPTGDAAEIKLHLLFERHFAPALGRFRVSVTTDSRAANPVALPPPVEAALCVPATERTPAQRETIFQHYLSVAPELADAGKAIERARDAAPKPPTTLVMAERPAGRGRPTFRHNRGEFLQPKEPVEPGVPAFLPPLPAGAPPDRLTLARWLVAPENPLTARVAVNRQWDALFGRGIVRTTGDFGLQGELPSHPELLDWLAVQFVKDGWSMKKLHRLIVTSATYRQSSRATPALVGRDPQNVLLARGPRVRADAEVVRDSALLAAGLLSEKIGGPSVFPPQPASVTTEGAYGPMTWTASTGPDRYRRSLYTFAKRTAPFAMYTAFDAPTGEACVARREVSNTPLQALTLLNDQIMTEASQAMGRTFGDVSEPDDAKATALFRQCLTRPPAADEVAMLVEFGKAQRARFASKELDAAKIAGGGGKNAAERATWTTVARAVLNLDEAVTKN